MNVIEILDHKLNKENTIEFLIIFNIKNKKKLKWIEKEEILNDKKIEEYFNFILTDEGEKKREWEILKRETIDLVFSCLKKNNRLFYKVLFKSGRKELISSKTLSNFNPYEIVEYLENKIIICK